MQRWLLVYFEEHDRQRLEPKAAMIATDEVGSMPFGVDVGELDIGYYAAKSPFVLVEMPAGTDFRPMVVDVNADTEVEMTFIES